MVLSVEPSRKKEIRGMVYCVDLADITTSDFIFFIEPPY